VLPQIGHLWAVQGLKMVIPLAGLILLSITVLVLWGILLGGAIKLAWDWWDDVQERRNFAFDLQEAEDMAELLLGQREREEYERQQQLAANWEPQRSESFVDQRFFAADSQDEIALNRTPMNMNNVELPTNPRPSRVSRSINRAPMNTVEPSTKPRPSRASRNLQERRVERPSRSLQEGRVEREVNHRRVAGEAARGERIQRVESGESEEGSSYDAIIWSIGTDQSISNVSSIGSSEVRGRVTNAVPTRTTQKQRQAYSQALPAPSRRTLANASPHASLRGQFRLVPHTVEDDQVAEVAMVYGAYDTLPYLDLDSAQDVDQESLQPDSYTSSREVFTEEPFVTTNKPLRLLVGIGLDPGIVRKDSPNEDNLFATQGIRTGHDGQESVGLFVVADGMGGHANGQLASRTAIQAISDVVAPVLLQQADQDETLSDLLKDGVHRANLAIYRQNQQQERMMGTTLTSALIVGTTAYVANVGDSRTYLYRASEGLRQITRDHSVVATLVEKGVITREEIYTHPKRNQIYMCLGEKPAVPLDTFEEKLQAGDTLILCSDGLWEMVRDNDLEQIVAACSPHASQISAMLVQAALSRGGADNISVVVVSLLHDE
jgi:serine/threonine protein phosphatase PrpC